MCEKACWTALAVRSGRCAHLLADPDFRLGVLILNLALDPPTVDAVVLKVALFDGVPLVGHPAGVQTGRRTSARGVDFVRASTVCIAIRDG
jgi:hypothetical protein